MTEIVTILSFLPIITTEYQELRLISQLNNIFDFDHNVFLLDSSADKNRFINKEENIPQSLYSFQSAVDNITGLDTLTEIKSKNTFVIVVLEIGKLQSNLNFLHQLKIIQRLQIKMKIGVFSSQVVAIDDLRNLFNWCKEHQIINIIASTYSHPEIIQGPNGERPLNIFTFNPFGTFDVVNVTGVRLENIFRNHEPNFQQHQLRLGEPFLLSFNEEFWLTVFRLMNASFIVVVHDSNYTYASEYFENGIDIIPQLKLQVNLADSYVHPMWMTRATIAVPEALPYAIFSAYLQAIMTDKISGYSLITIGAVMLLLIIFRYMKQKKIVIFQTVADVVNLLMNNNVSIKYQRLSRSEVFLIVPLTFVGFVIVNGMLSNLQSYLTRPVIQPQLNTIEDIYYSPFPIGIRGKHSKTVLSEALTNLTKHKDWSDKIFVMQTQNFYDQFYSYNTSNSYCIELDYAEHAVSAKKRLNIRAGIRGYHIPSWRTSLFYSSYYVNDKFLFFERLNEIALTIKSAGLWKLWVRRHAITVDSSILKMNLERLKTHKEVDIKKFHIPMFIVYGWSASIVAMVIEIIWKKFQVSRFVKKCL